MTPCLLRGAKVLAPTYALTFPPTPLFSHQARRPPPGHRQAPAQGSPSLRGASRAIAPASPPAPSAVLRSRRRFAAHARFRSGQHTFSKRRRRAANARSGTPSPPILTPSPRPPRRYRRLSGAGSACSSPADGSTTPSTGRSPTSCCTGAWGAPSGTRAARLRARFFKRRRGRSRETRADLARIRSRTTRRAPPPRSLAIAGERYPRVPPLHPRGPRSSRPPSIRPRRADPHLSHLPPPFPSRQAHAELRPARAHRRRQQGQRAVSRRGRTARETRARAIAPARVSRREERPRATETDASRRGRRAKTRAPSGGKGNTLI